jgi:hypothetical protein
MQILEVVTDSEGGQGNVSKISSVFEIIMNWSRETSANSPQIQFHSQF